MSKDIAGEIHISEKLSDGNGTLHADQESGTSEQRRRELADFLRTRREKIKPEQVGITQGTRRRTPGLRREEVAELAGVGTTWYTWLEQARDIQPSTEVLRRLGSALKLQPAELRHMFLLAGKSLPFEINSTSETLNESMSRILHQAITVPAAVLGARWDILALNKEAEKAFPGLMERIDGERNWVEILFCWSPLRDRLLNWDLTARRVVGEFRSTLSDSLDNPWVIELVERLKKQSPEFAALWVDHDVHDNSPVLIEMQTPEGERTVWERTVLYPGENVRYKLVIFTPVKPGHDL